MKAYFHYKKFSILTFLLLPISFVYSIIIKLRKVFYNKSIFKSYKAKVPVVIVGNITLGGTGKTPLTIYLVNQLKQKGFTPAVISRGYGSEAPSYPYEASQDSTAKEAGDEPLLIHMNTLVPVVIGANRRESIELVLKKYSCDIIISDDGLQHYALQRDLEIAVVDSERKFGNEHLFPAGPLREPKKRLQSVDFIICNGKKLFKNSYAMELIPGKITGINNQLEIDADFFQGKKLIACAGIGNPQRFFNTLETMGLNFQKQPMPDHYDYAEKDFQFREDLYYIMTEKDAVKCQSFATENMFYIPVNANLSKEFIESFISQLKA